LGRHGKASVNTLIRTICLPQTAKVDASRRPPLPQGDLWQKPSSSMFDGRPLGRRIFAGRPNIVNTMIKQLSGLSPPKWTRVGAREVAPRANLGGQAQGAGGDRGRLGRTWTERRQLPGQTISNGQVRKHCEVTIAGLPNGDSCQKITVGTFSAAEILAAERKHQHHGGPAPLFRVRSHPRRPRSRNRWQIGRSRRIGPGVAGKNLERPDRFFFSVNAMAANMTAPGPQLSPNVHHGVARRRTSSRKITVGGRPRADIFWNLKDTINTMVAQLNSVCSESTRGRRRPAKSAPKAKVGGPGPRYPACPDNLEGPHDNVNFMAAQLTAQKCATLPSLANASPAGDLSKKDHGQTCSGRKILQLRERKRQHHGRQFNAFGPAR